MKLTIGRIVLILLGAMLALVLVWRGAEAALGMPGDSSSVWLHVARGGSIAVLMSSLTAWLLVRYRRRYEQLLRTQKEESERLAALGQAAASMAHEVRNALAGIGGTLEVLQGSPAWRELPDDVADEVRLQMERIGSTVTDLLSYARPGEPELTPIDLHRVLDRALAASSRSIAAREVSVFRQYAGGAIWIDVDPARLEQAFQNIVINALQSMGGAGTLTVTTSRAPGGVRVCFTDTGAGMSVETMGRAFDPFFTTKARGTGLGLPIVRQIVESHGGSISLQSAPARGTSVTVILPPGSDAAPSRAIIGTSRMEAR